MEVRVGGVLGVVLAMLGWGSLFVAVARVVKDMVEILGPKSRCVVVGVRAEICRFVVGLLSSAQTERMYLYERNPNKTMMLFGLRTCSVWSM
jgi:hypothetical protein